MAKANTTDFTYSDLAGLKSDIKKKGFDIPVSEDTAVLAKEIMLGNKKAINRFAVQPMEGCDANPDGSPGPLTFRRYCRYAQGSSAIIWLEATAVVQEGRSCPSQLYLHKDNVDVFKELVAQIRSAAKDRVILILQLTHSGRFSKPNGVPEPVIAHHNPELDPSLVIPEDMPTVTDDYLDGLRESYLECAGLSKEAGFDGVDIKSCHGGLINELLASFTRPGKYGTSFENRSRFLLETCALIKKNVPNLFITTRINAYDGLAYPYGFGVDKDDKNKADLAEPIELIKKLREFDMPLINISGGFSFATSGIGEATTATKANNADPLLNVEKVLSVTKEIQSTFPDLPVVVGNLSCTREFVGNVAAGIINESYASIAGLGRSALASPDAPNDILTTGKIQPEKCCIACSACMQLVRDGGQAGCVIKDSELYAPEYRNKRQFALDTLKAEAERCHNCHAAQCVEACPAKIDIPGFISAFANDDIDSSYDILRKSNVLPEMCSHLCPSWMMCEGACIEANLNSNPIPIHDIQYAVSWIARGTGLTETKIPKKSSGKTIGIVGGGPTGISCAIKLIEAGHNVTILENGDILGGTPEKTIAQSRYSGASDEIEALLAAPLAEKRLEIIYNSELGKDISLSELKNKYDALLLAAGVREEISLGKAEGVIDAISFLDKVKSGEIDSLPSKVAVLSGGDCAMDCVITAKELGVNDLYIIYGGDLSDMHWHAPLDLFSESGTHCLVLTDPLSYQLNKDEKLSGINIIRMQYRPNKSGQMQLIPVKDSEEVIEMDMVIEAMGLGVSGDLKNELSDLDFNKSGLLKTESEDSFSTSIKNVFAAGGIINGGQTAVQCVAEGMKAAEEIMGKL